MRHMWGCGFLWSRGGWVLRGGGGFERAWWQTFVYVFLSVQHFKGQRARPTVVFTSPADWKHISSGKISNRHSCHEWKKELYGFFVLFSEKETITYEYNHTDINSFGFTYIPQLSWTCRSWVWDARSSWASVFVRELKGEWRIISFFCKDGSWK